jgi:hypothetical protein
MELAWDYFDNLANIPDFAQFSNLPRRRTKDFPVGLKKFATPPTLEPVVDALRSLTPCW